MSGWTKMEVTVIQGCLPQPEFLTLTLQNPQGFPQSSPQGFGGNWVRLTLFHSARLHGYLPRAPALCTHWLGSFGTCRCGSQRATSVPGRLSFPCQNRDRPILRTANRSVTLRAEDDPRKRSISMDPPEWRVMWKSPLMLKPLNARYPTTPGTVCLCSI